MDLRLTARERSAIHWTLLSLPVIAGIVAVVLVALVVEQFFTILAIFFLAWLLAFLLDPIVTSIVSRVPDLSRGVTAALVFIGFTVLLLILLIGIASSVVNSLSVAVGSAPTIEAAVANLLKPLQAQIDSLNLGIQLGPPVADAIERLKASASGLLGQVLDSGIVLFTQGTAIIFIAVVMVANKWRFLRFATRLVPEGRSELYDDFLTATSHSFGGFIRGQFGLAALYGLVVAAIAVVFNVPFVALIAVLTAALQSIPYFGQLVSWVPLAASALLFAPTVFIPVMAVLIIGLLVIQNIVSPRVLGYAVGLNPILVLAAVFVGAQVAGALGAVFGVPVAAVGASLFNAWLDRVRPLSEVPELGPAESTEARPGDDASGEDASAAASDVTATTGSSAG